MVSLLFSQCCLRNECRALFSIARSCSAIVLDKLDLQNTRNTTRRNKALFARRRNQLSHLSTVQTPLASICCGFTVQQTAQQVHNKSEVYNKFTTNRTSGRWV